MAMTDNHKIQIPIAPLKIAYLSGSHEMAKAVDNSLVKTRRAISGSNLRQDQRNKLTLRLY